MSDGVGGRRGRTALWALAALVGLWLYLRAVGVDAVGAALGRVASGEAIALAALGAVPVVLWGVTLHLVLRRLDVASTLPTAVALFAASGFLNNVTPFGQAGGDPVSGALVARVGRTAFERGFAAVVSVSAANTVALVGLGVVGGGVLLGTAAGARTLGVVGAALTLTAAAGVVATLAWRRRERLVVRVGGALGGRLARIGGAIPGVDPPGRDAVVERGRGFVAALERVAADRRLLAAALLLGVGGHLAVAATLWLALAAFDATVPPATVVVVVPAARVAGLSPTPGGTASAEALLTGLLVAVGGVDVPVAAAATLLYRAAAFWLPTLGGGVAAVALVVASDGQDARR